MLDQNTDRMWYVIGAVIIGAAIILILNNTFPQLFASVGHTFKDKTEDVGKVVDDLTMTDGIGPKTPLVNLINPSDSAVEKGTYVDEKTGELIRGSGTGSQHMVTAFMPVDAGGTYQFSSTQGNGVWYVRSAYYDKNHVFISGKHHNTAVDKDYVPLLTENMTTTAPLNAAYIRISADIQHLDTTDSNRTGTIDKWRFGKISE